MREYMQYYSTNYIQESNKQEYFYMGLFHSNIQKDD